MKLVVCIVVIGGMDDHHYFNLIFRSFFFINLIHRHHCLTSCVIYNQLIQLKLSFTDSRKYFYFFFICICYAIIYMSHIYLLYIDRDNLNEKMSVRMRLARPYRQTTSLKHYNTEIIRHKLDWSLMSVDLQASMSTLLSEVQSENWYPWDTCGKISITNKNGFVWSNQSDVKSSPAFYKFRTRFLIVYIFLDLRSCIK